MMFWLFKLAIGGADHCHQYILLVILYFIVIFNGCQSLNDPNSTIIKDIQSAFSIITNDTYLLNNIIYKMYKPALLEQKSMVVFQLPNEGKASTITIQNTIQMPRSMFLTPTFPNITNNAMMERIKKFPSLAKISDQWKLLGLTGWFGAVSQQQDIQIKEVSDSMNEYPIKEILKDLYDGVDKTSHSNTDDTSKAIEISSNVYIARVNDPFGFSTKWEIKNSTESRTKRDIVELYSMIKCATGCDPLGYKGYGCYCGFSGGGEPVDSIDYCCKVHDKCYEKAGNCISYLEYFVPYVWKCYFGKPLCALDHGEWGGPLSCAARLCYCDVQLSFCLRQFICPWNRASCPTRFARFLNLIT